MLFLRHRFGKEENRCGASTKESFRRLVIARRRTSRAWVLSSRTQFQAFQTGGDAQADLALQAERLKRDRVVGAADQHVAAGTDADSRAALRASIIAGEIARTEPLRRREHAPGQCGLLRDAEIDADLPDGGDIEVVGPAADAEHATEIGDGSHDEADARPAPAFQHADL